MSNFDDLNAIFVEGRLTKDPIIKDLGNNNCVSTLTIAVNSSYKGKDSSFVQEVGFFDIEVWNNAAKACNQYLTKGCKIRVKGSLKQNRWESNEGLKKSKVFIKADNVEFKSETKKSTSDKDEIESDEIEASLNINSIPTF